LLFFCISVFADVSINDPGDLLLKADAFLGTLDFNNSFKVGDKADTETKRAADSKKVPNFKKISKRGGSSIHLSIESDEQPGSTS
jgi:hypothetical protein